MSSPWSVTLRVRGKDQRDTRALADALATDETVSWNIDSTQFQFSLHESKCKDLRAMWNTRIRGLIAVDSLLLTLGDESEGSSTKTN
ncbi:MAG: hypothetical protein CMA63_02120 [Euryarchaeota archaeon]|nr:hypothetical protein [Euryarchaeota archaeon]